MSSALLIVIVTGNNLLLSVLTDLTANKHKFAVTTSFLAKSSSLSHSTTNKFYCR